MAEEEGKKEEEKLEFTPEGETLGYISLDQARVIALEQARDKSNSYGAKLEGIALVWEVVSAETSEDYYDIKLAFYPAGNFRGDPGVEHLVYVKLGDLRVRQTLKEPSDPSTATASPADEAHLSTMVSGRMNYESWLPGQLAREKAAVSIPFAGRW